MMMYDAVETVTAEYCKANDQLNVTSLKSGYIASVMTSDTPHCDGSSHPWLVSGQPGQTINLTLYDFAIDAPLRTAQRHPAVTPATVDQPDATAPTPASANDVCVQYGLVEDNGLSTVDNGAVKPIAICSDGRRRIQHVYQSVGNVVKIWITAGVAPTDLKRFVIHYQGIHILIMLRLSLLTRIHTGIIVKYKSLKAESEALSGKKRRVLLIVRIVSPLSLVVAFLAGQYKPSAAPSW